MQDPIFHRIKKTYYSRVIEFFKHLFDFEPIRTAHVSRTKARLELALKNHWVAGKQHAFILGLERIAAQKF